MINRIIFCLAYKLLGIRLHLKRLVAFERVVEFLRKFFNEVTLLALSFFSGLFHKLV